jgi:hypothetical protein
MVKRQEISPLIVGFESHPPHHLIFYVWSAVRLWFPVSFFICVGSMGGRGGLSSSSLFLVVWVLGFVLFISCEFVCERCVACAWSMDTCFV